MHFLLKMHTKQPIARFYDTLPPYLQAFRYSRRTAMYINPQYQQLGARPIALLPANNYNGVVNQAAAAGNPVAPATEIVPFTDITNGKPSFYYTQQDAMFVQTPMFPVKRLLPEPDVVGDMPASDVFRVVLYGLRHNQPPAIWKTFCFKLSTKSRMEKFEATPPHILTVPLPSPTVTQYQYAPEDPRRGLLCLSEDLMNAECWMKENCFINVVVTYNGSVVCCREFSFITPQVMCINVPADPIKTF